MVVSIQRRLLNTIRNKPSLKLSFKIKVICLESFKLCKAALAAGEFFQTVAIKDFDCAMAVGLNQFFSAHAGKNPAERFRDGA
jgi:hypothetical protein